MSLNEVGRLRFGGRADPPDRLVLGDNLAVTAGEADASLDLIYLDPPFGTGSARRAGRGQYRDDQDDPGALIDALRPCLAECRRLLRDHGSLFLHLDYRTVHYAKVALDQLFGRARFVNDIAWCYSVGGKSRRSFGKKHDRILWYARSGDHAFFPDAVRVARKASSHMRVTRDADGRAVQEKTDKKTGRVYRYPVDLGKVPEDWWTDIETLNRGDRERIGWPTQKPERLLERVVLATTQPGWAVGDFTCGSGTTAVVAQRLGRTFVTADREDAAVAAARDRLEGAGQSLAAAGSPPPDLVLARIQRAGRPSPAPSAPEPAGRCLQG